MKTRSIRILSLESKDIYAAMNLVNGDGCGYNIRNKDGAISLRKFENTLDWSLDTIKLQEEYEKAVRRKDFYFVVSKRKYTQVIINVKFSYSYIVAENSQRNMVLHIKMRIKYVEMLLNCLVFCFTKKMKMLLYLGLGLSNTKRQNLKMLGIQAQAKFLQHRKETS